MELPVFLAGVVIVGIVLLARSRAGGSGARTFGAPKHLDGEPINYGMRMAPPGTPPQAGTDAGWFGRTHDGDTRDDRASE